ncbi:MAG: Rdx family protein [Fimbriimonadaceae bacterium]|nr:Rdx family protein [Fimbriimonadaceae bacterium]QYK54749.1 MAG: Rdx family protein [Fimbriimonadaceae bacterium]
MAAKLVEDFRGIVGKGHPISELVLVPSGGGVFDVVIDGELVFSKRQVGRFPEASEISDQVRKRSGPGSL